MNNYIFTIKMHNKYNSIDFIVYEIDGYVISYYMQI